MYQSTLPQKYAGGKAVGEEHYKEMKDSVILYAGLDLPIL